MVDSLKGISSAIAAGILVVILVIVAAVYYGSTTGMFIGSDQDDGNAGTSVQFEAGDSGDTGLVIGTPVITDIQTSEPDAGGGYP